VDAKVKVEIVNTGQVDVTTNGKEILSFRNYVNSARQERVQNFYRLQHTNQNFAYVKKMEEKFLKLDLIEMGMWECLEFMDDFVDDSDPDTENSQTQHALQTAEAIRKKYPGEEYDWLHLTGLIHDLGKILSHHPKAKLPQWSVVGDTFPVGCAFSEKCVFPEYFKDNADYSSTTYRAENGIYQPGCGLSKLTMCWGHDEYLYQVCVRNGSTLPPAALYCIRYHSFYPWHKERAYTQFEDETDKQMLKWVKEFNQFDLYSKAHEKHDVKKTGEYYKKVIAKYFPAKLKW